MVLACKESNMSQNRSDFAHLKQTVVGDRTTDLDPLPALDESARRLMGIGPAYQVGMPVLEAKKLASGDLTSILDVLADATKISGKYGGEHLRVHPTGYTAKGGKGGIQIGVQQGSDLLRFGSVFIDVDGTRDYNNLSEKGNQWPVEIRQAVIDAMEVAFAKKFAANTTKALNAKAMIEATNGMDGPSRRLMGLDPLYGTITEELSWKQDRLIPQDTMKFDRSALPEAIQKLVSLAPRHRPLTGDLTIVGDQDLEEEKVSTKAQLLRLPVGTRLQLINSLMGPQKPSGRVVDTVRSSSIGFRIDDPTHKSHGKVSWLELKGAKIEPRANGFAVMDPGGELGAEYIFAEPASAVTVPVLKAEGQDDGFWAVSERQTLSILKHLLKTVDGRSPEFISNVEAYLRKNYDQAVMRLPLKKLQKFVQAHEKEIEGFKAEECSCESEGACECRTKKESIVAVGDQVRHEAEAAFDDLVQEAIRELGRSGFDVPANMTHQQFLDQVPDLLGERELVGLRPTLGKLVAMAEELAETDEVNPELVRALNAVLSEDYDAASLELGEALSEMLDALTEADIAVHDDITVGDLIDECRKLEEKGPDKAKTKPGFKMVFGNLVKLVGGAAKKHVGGLVKKFHTAAAQHHWKAGQRAKKKGDHEKVRSSFKKAMHHFGKADPSHAQEAALLASDLFEMDVAEDGDLWGGTDKKTVNPGHKAEPGKKAVCGPGEVSDSETGHCHVKCVGKTVWNRKSSQCVAMGGMKRY